MCHGRLVFERHLDVIVYSAGSGEKTELSVHNSPSLPLLFVPSPSLSFPPQIQLEVMEEHCDPSPPPRRAGPSAARPTDAVSDALRVENHGYWQKFSDR